MSTPVGAVITLETMYRELQEVHRALDRLVGIVEPLARASDDHERRIRSLERTKWMVAGAAAALGGGLGSAVTTLFGGS